MPSRDDPNSRIGAGNQSPSVGQQGDNANTVPQPLPAIMPQPPAPSQPPSTPQPSTTTGPPTPPQIPLEQKLPAEPEKPAGSTKNEGPNQEQPTKAEDPNKENAVGMGDSKGQTKDNNPSGGSEGKMTDAKGNKVGEAKISPPGSDQVTNQPDGGPQLEKGQEGENEGGAGTTQVGGDVPMEGMQPYTSGFPQSQWRQFIR